MSQPVFKYERETITAPVPNLPTLTESVVSKSLYLTATESKSGKSAIALCITRMLLAGVQDVAFFRPIINDVEEGSRDHDINLILSEF